MRPLAPIDFFKAPTPRAGLHDRPELCLMPLDRLVVDDRYQRTIMERGRRNIRRILENFDWRKFLPLVVTAAGDGRYAIIDGQHRATAALMHPDIEEVPCMVINATRAEAAECFAAINGVVTALTRLQIFHARLSAGDKQAMGVKEACDAAGVTICRHPRAAYNLKSGETLAVGAIEKAFEVHGRDVLVTALKAIVESGDGNPGALKASVIRPLCDLLAERPNWLDAGLALFDALDDVDCTSLVDAAPAMARNACISQSEYIRQQLHAALHKRLGPGQTEAMVNGAAA